MGLWTLVTDPRTFFDRRQDDYSLVGPALVVSAHALLALLTTVVLLRSVGDVITGIEAEQIVYAAGSQRISAPRQIVLALWGTGVLYFVLWVVVSLVTYLVSRYYDGTGSFRRVLAFVGWTLVPTLVPMLATSVVMIALFLDAPTFESEAAVEQWARANVVGNPVRVALQALRPLFTLWMVYLWVLAAEYSRELTRRQALVCVALPGAIAGLNALGNLAGLAAQALGLV
ncbi:YIP1 family protein [Halosimplex salinum]|uniref:YIP1 family protein n=1 Tax=Halosimplex salinum TaxID=1710538 RepID=UPI000F48808D|nr:YIP1 family protein [Halosimplex salinum]